MCVCAWHSLLDLQDGGVMVDDGQNDFVHVLSQTQVDLLLLLQGVHQLRDSVRRWKNEGRNQEETMVNSGRDAASERLGRRGRLTSSLEALSISAARH